MKKILFLVPVVFLVIIIHCGSGTGTGAGGSGSGVSAVINLQIANPDPNATGTAKAVLFPVADVSQTKATVTQANLTTCTLTVSASGMSTLTHSFSVTSSASTVTTSLSVPAGSSRTFAVDCSDGSATTNNITVGYNGSATADISETTSSISINPQFKNLISDASDVINYVRLNQENSTQTKLTVGFGSALTAAQKINTQVIVEMDTDGTRTSLGTISADQASGFVSGTKATPYIQLVGGTDRPLANFYTAAGVKTMRLTCSWATNDGGNTEAVCTMGITQFKTRFGSSETGQFAAVGSLTGASPWDALPNGGNYAKYDLSPNTGATTDTLGANAAACDDSTSRTGSEVCQSGFCSTRDLCINANGPTHSSSDTVATATIGGAFNTPVDVCSSPGGVTLYLVEDTNNTLYTFNNNTGVSAVLVTGVGNLNNPVNCVVDSSGTNIYVVTSIGNIVRTVVAATGAVTTLAGSGVNATTDGTGTGAAFAGPAGIAMDASDTNMYVAENGGDTIRKIVVSSGVVTTLAGSAGNPGSTDGTGTSAQFNNPTGLAIDSTGTFLYVADRGNNVIRRVTISSGVVTTIAGTGTASSVDGTGTTSATFNGPNDVVIDPTDETLYVVEPAGNRIRKIVISTLAVTTIAGTGVAGLTNGAGSIATFNTPSFLGINPDGLEIYVGDGVNAVYRRISAPAPP
ncbi:MAG: hypothetical protein A3H42_02605 [Deltaproteobacteria bacterium RIFCSPLOWO2_02_FULL_46_8]|nr:MAG: hypothetical protein A3H42_02605 [Deltaproteobacteria bacterium RIFCSPLOWO2_02_FULL_46_8]